MLDRLQASLNTARLGWVRAQLLQDSGRIDVSYLDLPGVARPRGSGVWCETA